MPPFRAFTSAALSIAALLFSMIAAGDAVASEDGPVHVMTDRAKVFRIDAPADTVIVGNPAIADVTMYDRQTVVVTGKLYGTTNLVILDKNGEPIIDEVITVGSAPSDVVTVMRNTARSSYSCSPVCEPVLRVGDVEASYDATAKQAQAHTEMSEKAAGLNN
ncbi:pilus assembly protein N-terminal domain-containing protein [Stappia sp. ICDLI1TA098]